MIDGGFKILFGNEKSKELTISLLSSIVGIDISDITFLNTENFSDSLSEKPVRYDILCQDSDHNKYLLEMQVQGHAGLMERSFYYISRCLSSQLGIGENYKNLKGVYGIFLLWCGIGDLSDDDYIKDFRIVNIRNAKEKVQGIRQIFVNLRKFDKKKEECTSMMDKWLYNLKYMNRNNEVAFKEREEVFRKLEQYAKEKNMTAEERLLYDLRVDAWRDYYADLDEAMEKGTAAGLIKAATAMKQMGLPTDTIMQATGLSADKIATL